jgi:hypothetical protein
MKRRLFVSSAVMAGLTGKLTEAFAATSLITRHPTITAFGSSGGIPSAYYTSVGGAYKYKHTPTSGTSTELKLTEYGIPTLESTFRIRYRNYNGMAALEEFNPTSGAAVYTEPQCVAFVKGMTGNLESTSTWYPGSALALNQTAWTASAMTGTVMAYFGSDNPTAGISYATHTANKLYVHVLCIVQVNLDSTGKVISAVVADQNFKTSGSMARWTIPYSGGAGRGYLKNYRIVMI